MMVMLATAVPAPVSVITIFKGSSTTTVFFCACCQPGFGHLYRSVLSLSDLYNPRVSSIAFSIE
jgi:hypothetical protein